MNHFGGGNGNLSTFHIIRLHSSSHLQNVATVILETIFSINRLPHNTAAFGQVFRPMKLGLNLLQWETVYGCFPQNSQNDLLYVPLATISDLLEHGLNFNTVWRMMWYISINKTGRMCQCKWLTILIFNGSCDTPCPKFNFLENKTTDCFQGHHFSGGRIKLRSS